MANSTNEAVSRRTRRALAHSPDGCSISSSSTQNSTSGSLAARRPVQRFDESSSEQQGSNGVTSARQGKTGLWSAEEVEELKRLVVLNSHPKGISWVKVEEAWKSTMPTIRSKASLSSKWSSLRTTLEALTQTKTSSSSPEDTTPHSNLTQEATPTVIPAVIPQTGQEGSKDRLTKVDTTFKVASATFQKFLKGTQKIGCDPYKRRAPLRVSGSHAKPIINIVDNLIANEIHSLRNITWNQLSILTYAGAATVSQMVNEKYSELRARRKEWYKKSYIEVDSLRKVLGKATAELNRRSSNTSHTSNTEVVPTRKQIENIRLLKRKYGAESYVDIQSLVEKLKGRLQLLQSRITLRKEDDRRLRVRLLPAKAAFRNIDNTEQKDAEVPKGHKIRKFWKNIVGMKKSFNAENKTLIAWQRSLNKIKGEEHLSDQLNLDLWKTVVAKSKPWKANGPDGIQGFWWKVFESSNSALYRLSYEHLMSGTRLPYRHIAEGRVILLHKSGSRSDPSNYRPIACLNTCYKLLTSFMAAYLYQYAKERDVLPKEQIALQKGIWGCTHALILDQTATADALNQKQHAISVAWVDYSKAFDSLPHAYLLWVLNAMQVPCSLRKFLKGLMKQWSVRYEVMNPKGKTERSSHLQIRSGVLQGDSFSPLLFCLAMTPISHAINKVGSHYVTASGKFNNLRLSLSHLFYMDDLKLYATSSQALDEKINLVNSISNAISMKLNVKKCAKIHFIPQRLRKEQVETAENSTADGDIDFPKLNEEEAYKYLGMDQNIGLKETATWSRVKEKYLSKVRQLWSSDLTFRQKVNYYNTAIIPMVTYAVGGMIKGSGKYQSVLESGKKLDTSSRMIMREMKARYKSNCKARLYITTETGGCGLISVRDSIKEKTIYTWSYLCTRAELKSSLNLFMSMANREKRCVVSDAENVLKSYQIDARIDLDHSRVFVNGEQFDDAKTLARHIVSLMRTANNDRRLQAWKALPLAGRVLRHSDVDVKSSFVWLSEGKLSSTAVRNVLAAQEGCLLVRAAPSSESTNKNCRMCGLTMETIEHVLSNCTFWLPNLYIDRHDSVARNIYYKLCRKYDLIPPHYSQKVEPVLENDRVKLYWNQPVQTKTIIHHNKPDIISFDKIRKEATILEIAVSWFTGILEQKERKRNRYCVNGNYSAETTFPYPRGDNLVRELQSTGWKVTFTPIVIGATGEADPLLHEELSQALGINSTETEKLIERLQRSAVLGTSRIIKNHLVVTGRSPV